MNKWLKKAEIAEYHRVSSGTIDAWVAEGKIEVHRTPGGRPRFLNPDYKEPEAS